MKKSIFVLILLMFITACVREETKAPQIDVDIENTKLENNDLLNFDDYMVSVKQQSDSIKKSLENDALTQTDMNIKSQELYELWDDALNYLWDELANSLSEEKFIKLQDEQRIWITEKEKTIEEVGKDFEGGSIYPLVVNSEAAKITEERIYELYKYLCK